MQRKNLLSLLLGLSCLLSVLATRVTAAESILKVVEVQVSGGAQEDGVSVDAVVESIRQTTISSQVAGAIVALHVKVGDRVKSGQPLVRIDGRSATQGLTASTAQVEAARATMNVASKEFERQKQLLQKQYISQSALDKSQAQLMAAQAQVKALEAQAGVALTQTGFFLVTAPYDAVVSEVPVALGDMAMPGRALLTLYDPSALRLTAAVPQSAQTQMGAQTALRFELPGALSAPGLVKAEQVQWLPTMDPATHSVQLRLNLPTRLAGVTPGMFGRVWLPMAGGGAEHFYVPISAIVRRAEIVGVYVQVGAGRPLLRQVRLGTARGGRVEILSGLAKGDKVAIDPQAAAKVR